MTHSITALCDFLDHAHSAYHAQNQLVRILDSQGYSPLAESAPWALASGGKYYVCRGGSSVIAFRIPTEQPRGFLTAASHTDRPSLKVKENGEQAGAYTRLGVEVYGGALLSTWADRPLSIAGRVMVQTETGADMKLVDIDRDLLLIPNVAIHMNRQANDGTKWNPTVDIQPLLGSKENKGGLQAMLEETAGGKILGHDLYLYLRQKPSLWGIREEFISAQALDDLQCVWGTFQGFLSAKESAEIPVFCAFNSEEIGSRTQNGADSTMLADVMSRICEAMGWDLRQLLAQSFLVSADNAHAIHPNHPELADAANAPVLGGGIVLKFNANQRYCTDGLCAAVFRSVCAKAGVNVQSYYNRPDIPGGSTLGNVSIGHVSIPTADIGLPQLAMHSCYETASVDDSLALIEAMTVYFGSNLEISESGFCLK